jgi:hypothetical protein
VEAVERAARIVTNSPFTFFLIEGCMDDVVEGRSDRDHRWQADNVEALVRRAPHDDDFDGEPCSCGLDEVLAMVLSTYQSACSPTMH